MNSKAKVVFLYTEIAGYFLACANELSKSADVLVVRYPVNKEAPFNFDFNEQVKIVDKNELSSDALKTLIVEFEPTVIICSGWIDKLYLNICKSFKKKIPIVLTLDNHWTGSFKQHIATFLSPFTLKRIFTHAWVPGNPQAIYAYKLGFSKDKIVENFYCADVHLFDNIYTHVMESKRNNFPHKFLYVARYVEHKGIFEMWNAFKKLCEEHEHDWELICLGTGDQWENRMIHPKIKHIGFVQPAEMTKYIEDSGVYILPSKFEPWGVSLQEFAICGMPVLVSDKVGSATRFVNNNGIIFKSGSAEEIYNSMKIMISKSDQELFDLGLKSHEIGLKITPTIWTQTILNLKN